MPLNLDLLPYLLFVTCVLGCSLEPSHWDGTFEYPRHMFWLRNKKNNVSVRTLIWRPAICGSLNISSKIEKNLIDAAFVPIKNESNILICVSPKAC